ncbi:MAG TPA: AraC family transcriptional regulator, partial [Verrucomicrobiae bacterium]|nr:AraC family transcriptional regulator [Verrucomicrobiae bacterium]
HKIIFPHGEYPLKPAHLALIPDHQLFHCQGLTPAPNFWLTFQVSRRLTAHHAIPIILPIQAVELQLLRQLTRQFTGIGAGDAARIFHLSMALLHVVLVRPEIQWLETSASDNLRRTIRLMETAYAQPAKMASLARVAGLSVRGFSQAFKRSQGVTPGRFLTQVRVREAANLLANTHFSIEEIAEKTGFPNRHYLSRKFKQITGDSPARFRATLRRNRHTRPATPP